MNELSGSVQVTVETPELLLCYQLEGGTVEFEQQHPEPDVFDTLQTVRFIEPPQLILSGKAKPNARTGAFLFIQRKP